MVFFAHDDADFADPHMNLTICPAEGHGRRSDEGEERREEEEVVEEKEDEWSGSRRNVQGCSIPWRRGRWRQLR